ncbi:hypothetical protein P3X46_029812 [Hevea brasiliensis]|uniref:FBD domain-containing protein n=1 Tax=Hevea brasiliensis TaxID=3981 RepID=A0ABQ9KVG8_HEVBR|nr:hypothetical protein P3X46_029812 [Hevea brasiliensis]
MISVYGWTMSRRPEQGKDCNLVRVLGSLGGIDRLCLHGQFLDFLANENVPQGLPAMLNCLSALELKEVRFTSLRDVMSSNLKDLITVDTLDEVHKPVMDFFISQCLYDFYLNQLKVVNIRGIVGTRTELEFIKLLLAHSPMLESMTIVTYSGERISESVLLQLEQASEHVKFISLTQ